jgi:hypothetical protein
MVTVITKTIGPNPAPPALPEYDYSNFTDAEADVEIIATLAFGSTDLVASDGAIVFEAAAGTYNEPSQIVVSSSLTTDATRNVTYKAAAGSEHGGILDGGVFIDQLTGSPGFFIEDANTHLIGLGVRAISDACSTKVQGTVARNCIFESTTQQGLFGIENAGIVAENCVSFHQGNRYGFAFYTLSGFTADGKFRNCTAINRAPSGGYGYNLNSQGGTITAEIVNCLTISDRAYRATAVGPVTVTGSNNFGVSNYPFPVALQGTPATITASTAYDPGAGDFALYVGKNGALLDSPNNDVIAGGVGPSVNSDVPTTDILGNARSGALANPGAFEVPQATTVITRTIGAPGSGRDYISFTDAEADVTNIGTSADLVFNNERIVFEADARTYTEDVVFTSTLTTDATRNVTYRAAAGSEHRGDPSAGVIIEGSIFPIKIENSNYTVFDGLHAKGTFSVFAATGFGGIVCRNLILTATGSYGIVATPNSTPVAPITIENCVATGASFAAYTLRATTVAGTVDYKLRNCTSVGTARCVQVGDFGVAGSVTNIDAVNNLALAASFVWVTAGSGTINVSGSNNFGSAGTPFPVAIQGSPYPVTSSTSYDPGAGDYALYVASNGALLDSPNNDVIGKGLSFLDGAGDVPGYDIIGNPRGAKISNPGAFEIPQGPTVVTKTIGEGRDYIDFTDAEADVETIATLEFGSTDLVANNGAIVFEADAGTYSEGVTFNSTLTTDQTRNVTYKAATGSEHGGVPGAGVKIVSTDYFGLVVEDRFMVFSGLEVVAEVSSSILTQNGADGTTVENCILSPWVYGFLNLPAASVTNATYYIRNCVFRALRSSAVGYDTRGAAGATTSYVVANCSAFDGDIAFRHAVGADAASTTSLTLVNNWSSNCDDAYIELTTGTVTVTGSNNFGGSKSPFPVALRGTPYPVTATTDTDPGPGDWAIYDAVTGALIDDPDNDVLGGGVGPDADADVPTTDIVGNIRSGDTTDPGAFQRPALDTTMTQIYQQDAPFTIGASPSGVSGITHQPGPAALDYFTINSTTSATITVPRTAHALRVICVAPLKACDVTLELNASNSVYLGTIGGVSNVQADLEYFWSFASVASDGAYPRVKIEYDGVFSGDQLVYLWWHLA